MERHLAQVFESSVIPSGSKTPNLPLCRVVPFESSVIPSGSKTSSRQKAVGRLFESSVIPSGSKTFRKNAYDPTGSGTGIESARTGSCDIGLASRALKTSETGLTGTVVALDGIAIIVNKDCPVDDLTIEQIAAIFKGGIKNWNELGGEDLAISCVGRESGSGTRDGFESVTGTSEACVLAQELTSTGAVISAVAANPNAIGYASLSAVEGQDGIKALKVNGVDCSEETVLDGTYAVQRPFVLVTREGETLSPAAQAFFDYATGTAANDLIRQAGAVPVAK